MYKEIECSLCLDRDANCCTSGSACEVEVIQYVMSVVEVIQSVVFPVEMIERAVCVVEIMKYVVCAL